MRVLALDTVGVLRTEAERRVNAHFNSIAAEQLQRDHEHIRKRELAAGVLRGEAAGPLAAEAKLQGVSELDFANLILSKDDQVLARGLDRRRAIVAIRAAEKPYALDAILIGLGLTAVTQEAEI